MLATNAVGRNGDTAHHVHTVLENIIIWYSECSLQGLNMVRSQLVSMTSIKYMLNPHYYVDVVWAFLDGIVKHFNQCMAMNTLQGASPIALV